MNKLGKIAAVLLVSAGGVVIGGAGSTALAGLQPGVTLNASMLPADPCLPEAASSRSIDRGIRTANTQANGCSQTIRHTRIAPRGVRGNQEEVVSDPFIVDAGVRRTVTQSCPEGMVVIGGGYALRKSASIPGGADRLVRESGPNATGTGWDVEIDNSTDDEVEVTITAVCADPA